jgi:hypothetical protein
MFSIRAMPTGGMEVKKFRWGKLLHHVDWIINLISFPGAKAAAVHVPARNVNAAVISRHARRWTDQTILPLTPPCGPQPLTRNGGKKNARRMA